jgi:hypothetical protein
MRGKSRLLLALVFLAGPVPGRANEVIVPAGTLLQCTLSEPNLSSKTAEVGEPLLCQAGPLTEFGRSVFPHGAYLVGHFADYRDPGHFWGKGWMRLNFDRIVLPDQVLPLSTKVTYVPDLTVDAKGRMHGRGHAGRDAVEWLIPPLWPWKVVTLPLRGPRPTLKGENRITLKLMDDVVVPTAVGAMDMPARPTLQPQQFRFGNSNPADDVEVSAVFSLLSYPPQVQSAALNSEEHTSGAKVLTLLMLKDGTARVATDYWFEGGQRIRYLTVGGEPKFLPITSLNFSTTAETNRQRGVEFVIRLQNTEY